MTKAAKKPHAAAATCEVNDHVFAEHPRHGPMAVKIVSKGLDGFHGRAEDGQRHGFGWDAIRGHKARALQQYKVVDRGADGALLEDDKGRRRYVAGEVPGAPAPPEPAPKPDDPLTGGLSRLSKASSMNLPDGPMLLFKSTTLANRPGLSLAKITDKAGHTTQRWKRSSPDEPKEKREPRVDPSKPEPARRGTPDVRANPADRWKTSDPKAPATPAAPRKEPTLPKPAEKGAAPRALIPAKGNANLAPKGTPNHDLDKRSLQDQIMEGDVPPPKTLSAEGQAAAANADAPMKHGDTISFRHENVVGSGKIVASGADGVTVHDGEREHQVRHDKLEGKVEPPTDGGGGGDGGGNGGDEAGDQPIPPDKFNAHQYAAQHIDTSVTAEQILEGFPPDTAAKIDATNKKIAAGTPSDTEFKKNGKWTAERSAKHQEIVDHFLSDERVAAAMPADGQDPTFTILGGRGGSGKSKLEGVAYDPSKAIVLDADEIKQKLPGYEGWNAALLHEESGEIFDRITEEARAMGLNIVHDATMKTGHKAVALVKAFKDAGYRAEAHYMFLPPQEAAKRAVDRFLGKTKRFVPPGVVLGNVTNEASFDQVKPLVDAWSFRDNNVARGQEPRLISESGDDETNGRTTGLPGLHAAPGKQLDRAKLGAGGAVREDQGGAGGKTGLQKSAALGGRVALLFKAQIAGGAIGDLLAIPVQVKGHTTKGGVTVKPHTAIRHKNSAPADHGERHAAGQAAYKEAYTAPVITSTTPQDGYWARAELKGKAGGHHEPAENFATREEAAAAAWREAPHAHSVSTARVNRGVRSHSGIEWHQPSAPRPILATQTSVIPTERNMLVRDNPTDASHFYVSAIDGSKRHLVAGPYASHEDAKGMVDHVRKHADYDPRAHFMAWGTAGSARPMKTPLGPDWKPAA